MATLALFICVAAAQTVGPILDPIRGSTVGKTERQLLPSGRNTASVADLWFVELLNLHPGSGGGIASFDPPYISSHGLSWTQQRYFLNGLEMTDPAHPGTPLIQLPYRSWSSLTSRSLWTDAPGLYFSVPITDASAGTESEMRVEARLAYGRDVGGGTWVPAGLMDREPALRTGADPDRRALRGGTEVDLVGRDAAGVVAADHVEATHYYPTLARDSAPDAGEEQADRTTLLFGRRLHLAGQPVDLALVLQNKKRDNAGAQWRHPYALTRTQMAQAALTQAATRWRSSDRLAIEMKAGVGWRHQYDERRLPGPLVTDIEDQWTWMRRPGLDEVSDTWRVDAATDFIIGSDEALRAQFKGSYSGVQLGLPNTADASMMASTYMRGITPEAQSVSMTRYDAAAQGEQRYQTLRLQTDGKQQWGGTEVLFSAGLDWAAVSAGGPVVSHLTPAAGVAVRQSFGGGEAYALLRREPMSLTRQVADFVDAAQPNGKRYRWNDDGNRIPQAGEEGALLARTGPDARRVDNALRRPTSNQLAVGWRHASLGPVHVAISGAMRALENRYTVRMRGPAAESYGAVVVEDPGGDGLGETTPKGESQALQVYARTPGTEGQEIYELTNASKSNLYAGAEIQIGTTPGRWWFVNVAASGYWNIGAGAFGLFADRNDPGIIDEGSADPNARVNQRGRIDADRAFGLNVLAGLQPGDDTSMAMVLRYRDGEPMTRMFVVDDLPQGPTTVMAVPRGAPVPRYTFHMTLDIRARHQWSMHGTLLSVVLDVSNLLGSGTEMLEDVRTGDTFRRSVEMVPGRAAMLSLEIDWQP